MEASICTDRSKQASVWHISGGAVVGEDVGVGVGDVEDVGVGVGEEVDDDVEVEDDVVEVEDDVVEVETDIEPDDVEVEDDAEDEDSLLLTPYRITNVMTSNIAITRKMTKRTIMTFWGVLRKERTLSG